MDFRTTARVPLALFPTGECRFYIGEADTAKKTAQLEKVRDSLQWIARRGDWTVLRRIKDRDLTAQEVHAAVQQHGDAYLRQLARPGKAVTIQAAADEWVETLSGRTQERYEVAIRRLVAGLGPDHPMDATITRGDIMAAMDELKKQDFAQNTRAAHQIAWSAFFTWYMEREEDQEEKTGRPPQVVKHPVRAVKKRHKVRVLATKQGFLTEDQFAELLRVSSEEMRAHYATMLYCALRPDEFFHLRPEDVVLPSHVRVQAREGWAPKGFTRWGVGEGSIPVHRTRLLPLLERHAAEWAGTAWFFLNPGTGRQWRHEGFALRMRKDCDAAGIPYGRSQKDGVTPHIFRHTLASWLAKRDVQLKKIASLLRDTVTTVDKHYAHLLPTDLDATLNRVL